MGASTVLMATAHHEKKRDSDQYFHRRNDGSMYGTSGKCNRNRSGQCIFITIRYYKKENPHNVSCKGTLITASIGIWSRFYAHYALKALSVPEVMKENTIPVLLVHGTADSNVPVEMTIQLPKTASHRKNCFWWKEQSMAPDIWSTMRHMCRHYRSSVHSICCMRWCRELHISI